MKIRFIGDIHGNMMAYSDLTECDFPTVQVGDYGIGFGAETIRFPMKDRFIRGNHDKLEECKKIPNWIPDGLIDNNGIMYVGGAWSIDFAGRVEGVNWWPWDEELSIGEFNKLIDIYEKNKPRIMVTHDAPDIACQEMMRVDNAKRGLNRKTNSNRTAQGLQGMFDIHKPKLWIFGHWHHDVSFNIDGTVFVCLGINSYFDVDTLDV